MSDLFIKLGAKAHIMVLDAHQSFKRLRDEERGAETIQVIMIMGIMALIIAAVFLTDNGIRSAIIKLGNKVENWITNVGSSSPSTTTSTSTP